MLAFITILTLPQLYAICQRYIYVEIFNNIILEFGTFHWCSLGHFIPDDFFILMTAFMDRGSVTYKNLVYFFFRRKKNI